MFRLIQILGVAAMPFLFSLLTVHLGVAVMPFLCPLLTVQRGVAEMPNLNGEGRVQTDYTTSEGVSSCGCIGYSVRTDTRFFIFCHNPGLDFSRWQMTLRNISRSTTITGRVPFG